MRKLNKKSQKQEKSAALFSFTWVKSLGASTRPSADILWLCGVSVQTWLTCHAHPAPVPLSSPPLTAARVVPKLRSAAWLPPAVRARPRLLKGVRLPLPVSVFCLCKTLKEDPKWRPKKQLVHCFSHAWSRNEKAVYQLYCHWDDTFNSPRQFKSVLFNLSCQKPLQKLHILCKKGCCICVLGSQKSGLKKNKAQL